MDPEAIRQKRKVLLDQWCAQREAPEADVNDCGTKAEAKLDAGTETTPPIPVELDCIIQDIATTGKVPFAWEKMRVLLAAKLEQCCHESWIEDTEKYCDSIEAFEEDVMKRLMEMLTDAQRLGPPFTAQRMCELLVDRAKLYKSTRIYCSALEKTLMVSSVDTNTVEQSRKRKAPEPEGRENLDAKRDVKREAIEVTSALKREATEVTEDTNAVKREAKEDTTALKREAEAEGNALKREADEDAEELKREASGEVEEREVSGETNEDAEESVKNEDEPTE